MESREARPVLDVVAEAERAMERRSVWPGALVALSCGAALSAATLGSVLWTAISLNVLVVAVVAWWLARGYVVRDSARQPVRLQDVWSWREHWPILLLLAMIPFPGMLHLLEEPSDTAALVTGLLGAAAAWMLVDKDHRR